ncbi:hypothetical protein Patl1_35201 [Pistacia atlantica]|uniref:Uncharacterized protein n=1 Tax=Pistacia atlantica TaxID=434234 RepID=A0ACC0ZT38_9ROSI|nr:hypothetical protein Patl1_35201 [Pistacia atlantica]
MLCSNRLLHYRFCRGLEVIELDQKTELVLELDGHVMRCVHDQNGNHLRVLEHCSDEQQGQRIVDEILESAYVLAQGQNGNYVTQVGIVCFVLFT